MIRENTIKLADFGLSKRFEASSSKKSSNLFGVIPYIDPKRFHIQKNNDIQTNTLNEKSDVYSVGVLLWEISSGHPPFEDEQYDIGLAVSILQGLRETTVPDTPDDYAKLYIGKYLLNFNYNYNNVLVHRNIIKLADFGLSKRIEEATNTQTNLFGIIPYIDPKRFRKNNHNYIHQMKRVMFIVLVYCYGRYQVVTLLLKMNNLILV